MSVDQPKMHRCLRIDEVLQMVADSLTATLDTRALLYMALTCRGFLDPAMNALWRNPRDGMCLIDLLTDATFARVKIDGECEEMMALHPPSASDWTRFSKYARRVETLDVMLYTDTDTPLHWYSILEHFPGTQIFPRLRSVCWDWVPECRCSHVALLLKAPLRSLVVDDLDLRGVEQLIELLPGYSTTLEHLELTTVFSAKDQPQVAARLWQALVTLQRLVHLDVSLYASQAFRHLASLSNVKTLRLVIDSVDLQDTRLPFPSLTSFDVSVKTDRDEVARLLRRMTLPALEQLTITYYAFRRGPANPVPQLSAPHVRQQVSKLSSLRSFTLISGPYVSREPMDVLDASTLSPLHALHDLETLHICDLAVNLTAADIEPMARAWPRMQDLQLYKPHSRFATHSPHTLIVDDILPFARLCPDLRALGLPVQLASKTEPGDERPQAHAALKTLWVHDMSSPRRKDGVKLLAQVFPLVELESYDVVAHINEAMRRLVHSIYGTQFARR